MDAKNLVSLAMGCAVHVGPAQDHMTFLTLSCWLKPSWPMTWAKLKGGQWAVCSSGRPSLQSGDHQVETGQGQSLLGDLQKVRQLRRLHSLAKHVHTGTGRPRTGRGPLNKT
eukprot:5420739-Amphidinium_carterae.2